MSYEAKPYKGDPVVLFSPTANQLELVHKEALTLLDEQGLVRDERPLVRDEQSK